MEQNSSISNSSSQCESSEPVVAVSRPGEAGQVWGVSTNRQEETKEAVVALLRICSFFAIVAVLILGLDAMITAGLGRMKTTVFGVSNRIMGGNINAQIVITGSSRAASHYDPRIIQVTTGYSTFNLGRNGSQTDMQIAVLKAYLKHNRMPEIVVHNLDAFTFQTTREVYNVAQYIPYLSEEEIYQPLAKINPTIWKSRYLPLYGYVAEDMSFAWILGLRAFLPLAQRDNLIDGFDPRIAKWTDEFARFKGNKREPVRWDIEPDGIRLMDNLIALCHNRKIKLILVYSPEYIEMQKLTGNRREIFDHFRLVASRHQIPIWDFSEWQHMADTEYFTNSQHLNAVGAEAFSTELAKDLKKYIASEQPRTPPSKVASQ